MKVPVGVLLVLGFCASPRFAAGQDTLGFDSTTRLPDLVVAPTYSTLGATCLRLSWRRMVDSTTPSPPLPEYVCLYPDAAVAMHMSHGPQPRLARWFGPTGVVTDGYIASQQSWPSLPDSVTLMGSRFYFFVLRRSADSLVGVTGLQVGPGRSVNASGAVIVDTWDSVRVVARGVSRPFHY